MPAEVWNNLAQFGLPGILAIVILVLLLDPTKAELLRKWVFAPFFRLFRWGSRQYLASSVGYATNHFFGKNVFGLIPSLEKYKLAIKWVKTPADPIFRESGKLILCLQETPDQTLNILSATRVALPRIVCPTIRPNIDDTVETAIDLVLVRRMAEALGRHARPIFQRHFYSTEVAGNSEAEELYAQLVQIDEFGVFVAIFIQEVSLLGEASYSRGSTDDESDQVRGLLQFLLTLARRRVGQEIQTTYFDRDLRIGIVLCAKRDKALKRGIQPYVDAIRHDVRKGCDNIYVVAYPGAREIFNRTLNVIEGDPSIELHSTNVVTSKSAPQPELSGNLRIACLRRLPLFQDSGFQQRIELANITVGTSVNATVMDISTGSVLVDVAGINGIIKKKECSWFTVLDCHEAFEIGDTPTLSVLSIENSREILVLSLRTAETDPWNLEIVPSVGDVIDVDVRHTLSNELICMYRDCIEIIVPYFELKWVGIVGDNEKKNLMGTLKVKTYAKDEQRHEIRGSVRRLAKDPWPEIHADLPKGTAMAATVREVYPTYIRVELPNGLSGIIPDYEMSLAGFEYADFANNVVSGQGLDVVVTKVFIGKRKIRLGLRRVHT